MRETLSEIMSGIQVIGRPKLVANNTAMYTASDGSTRWRYHHIDIVTKTQNGEFILNSGGWLTPTTKERINSYAPVRLCQTRGNWWIYDPANPIPFYDGMRVDCTGKPIDPPAQDMQAARDATRKKVNKFARLCESIDVLPVPGGGDCWLCMGLFAKGAYPDCLQSHLDENYLHGTLLVNAMRAAGYEDTQIGLHYHMNLRDTFKRALRRYMLRGLGIAC